MEVVARINGIPAWRLPLLRPVQGVAAALVAGQAAGLLAPAVATASPGPHTASMAADVAVTGFWQAKESWVPSSALVPAYHASGAAGPVGSTVACSVSFSS